MLPPTSNRSPLAFFLLAYALMRLSGQPVAPVRLTLATPLLLLIFFIAAQGEELGWSGYAIDPLQARFGPLLAAIILGIIWAVWHIVAMVQAGQSPGWIAWAASTWRLPG